MTIDFEVLDYLPVNADLFSSRSRGAGFGMSLFQSKDFDSSLGDTPSEIRRSRLSMFAKQIDYHLVNLPLAAEPPLASQPLISVRPTPLAPA
jgi:hypothetical protein